MVVSLEFQGDCCVKGLSSFPTAGDLSLCMLVEGQRKAMKDLWFGKH